MALIPAAFTSAISGFKGLRPPVRSLILLYWIYTLVGGLVGVFTQIFLYEKFTSIPLNVVATIVFYTGLMVGFCIPGYLASVLRLNIKQGFMWSFIATAIAILYLLHSTNVTTAYVAMFLWGIGQGIFWLTVNTFELSETKDGERDFYSSVLTAGNQILTLISPAIATVLIWLSGSVFSIGTYTLLFTAAPAVYLLGFFCFSNLRDYHPPRIEWADIVHFFTDRRNQIAQLYTLGTGFQHTLHITVLPLVTFFIFGSALRVGAYGTAVSVLSIACILLLAPYRTSANRLYIYGVTMVGIAIATAWLGYAFTLTALILYAVAAAVLFPISRVSAHVIDLHAMEIGRKETDFYATMLLRDVFLWVWRCAGGLLFLFVLSYFGTEREYLSAGMYMTAAALLITYLGAYLLVRSK